MEKIVRDDIQKAQGLKFLIPLAVLPEKLEWMAMGALVKMSVVGQIVEIDGTKYLQTESWGTL